MIIALIDSLALIGTNFVIIAFLLMAINAIFCFIKIPIVAIPLGLITWIVFFAFALNIDSFNFILIIITLFFASASIVLNAKEIRK